MMLPSGTSRVAASGTAGSADDLRCECGRLVARVSGMSLELKCGRCKRVLVCRVAGDRLVLDPGDDHACEPCGNSCHCGIAIDAPAGTGREPARADAPSRSRC